jgi:hypothetical protein
LCLSLTGKTSSRGPGRPFEKGQTAATQKGPGVWILENNIPKRINITPGISDGSYTEVAGREIRDGQEVVVESLKKKKASPQPGPRMY